MKATISTKHSVHFDKLTDQRMTVQLEGGSPYFAYIWINDECYALRKANNGNTFKIARVK